MRILGALASLMLLAGCSTLGFQQEDEGCPPDSDSVCIDINNGKAALRDEIEQMLMQDEGFSSIPYADNGNTSIGYGRNLTTNGISRGEALYLMQNDLDNIELGLKLRFPISQDLDRVRYYVVVTMAYTMGLNNLAEFKDMWTALEQRQYDRAALAMYMSQWCNQVKQNRCSKLATMMDTGRFQQSECQMPLIPLRFRPGINRDITSYAEEGGWYECDKVRFRQGLPEKIGGWSKYSVNTFLGVCRNMFGWVTSYSDDFLAIGTNIKAYIESGGAFYDITPLRLTSAAGDVTFTATSGSTTLTVNHISHNALVGDYVTFEDALSLTNGITAAVATGTPGSGVLTVTAAGVSTGTATFSAVAQDATSGVGTGATFNISAAGGTYTVTAVAAAGSGYSVGDTITIDGANLGGASGTNDLTLTVATIVVASFTTVTQDSTSGDGYGAEFTIGVVGGVYTLTAITTSGYAYAPGDTVTVDGANLGGASGTNDLTLTITTVTAGTVTTTVLNDEYLITSVTANTFTVTLPTAANAFDTGDGGTAVVGKYQIHTGLTTSTYGYGWSTGTWGRTGWGAGSTPPLVIWARYWWYDNFDNDIVLCYNDGFYGKPYIWQRGAVSNPSVALATRAIPLEDLPGASDAPTEVGQLLVSQNDKHLLAFGCTVYGGSDYDPMLIRWASQDAPEDWTPQVTNSAGFIRVSRGSLIKRAFATRQEILVFTDTGLHSLQFTGTSDVFSLQELNSNISLMGPRAVTTANNIVFWMGHDKFYAYTGRVETLPCPLKNHLFSDFNHGAHEHVMAGTNEGNNEVWWFYPSASSADNDSYIIYNYVEKIWYYGTMDRTAWLDSGLREYPQAVYNGYIYNHENGIDDDGIAMNAYIESADFDLQDGEQFMLTRRMIPDVNFEKSTAALPEVSLELKPRQFPGTGQTTSGVERVIRTTATTHTPQVHMRARGRAASFKISSNTVGTQWQLGLPRLDARPDGKR